MVDGLELMVKRKNFFAINYQPNTINFLFDSARSLTSTRRVHFLISCRPRLFQAIHGHLYLQFQKIGIKPNG
jgi:hypothetical protein